MVQYKTIDEYIKIFPPEVQEKLEELRKDIKKLAPESTESISYGIPTFKTNGKYLIYFAAFKTHFSIYPVTAAIEEGLPEISKYRTGKGTLQFPIDKDLPLPLIRKIVKIRLKENQERNKKG